MASLYVSLCSVIDGQLRNTIESALANTSKLHDVTMGIAFTTPQEFIDDHMDLINKYGIRFSVHDPETEYGVGRGRKNAMLMYQGEDLFVQVDAHTNFEQGWDDFIVKLYADCLQKTNNDRTVITAYIGQYIDYGDGPQVVSNRTRYPMFTNEPWWNSKLSMNAWSDFEIRQWPSEFKTNEEIIPANKMNAQFVVSTIDYVESNCSPENTFFMEEEIIPAINLLYDGFSLAFPNMLMPVTHLPINIAGDFDASRRQLASDLAKYGRDSAEWIMSRNYYDFVYDDANYEKCKMYEDHAGYAIFRKVSAPFYIPKKFGYYS